MNSLDRGLETLLAVAAVAAVAPIAVGYGFFIRVFFVASGMTLDVLAVLREPSRLLIFLGLLLLIRGLHDGVMLPANAAAMVGAGAFSVLIYPAIAAEPARGQRKGLAPQQAATEREGAATEREGAEGSEAPQAS